MLSLASKRRIYLALAALLVSSVLFSGCSASREGTAGAGAVVWNEPVEISYVTMNNLEIKRERREVLVAQGEENPWAILTRDVENGGAEGGYMLQGELVSITGLKDKTVEDAIHTKIEEAAAELLSRDIPPYRGIRTRIGDDAVIDTINFYVSESANFNNVLSLEMQKYTRYLSGDEACGVNDSVCLNFDLNTGEVLSFADLFRDGADWNALINQAVQGTQEQWELADLERRDEFMYEYSGRGISLIEPFRGIDPEQPFLLQPEGMTILFDYRNPEVQSVMDGGDFYGNRESLTFHDLEGELVYPEKYFRKGESLYLKEAPVRRQLVEQGWSSRRGEHQKMEEGNFEGSLSLYLPVEWPEKMKEKARSMAEYDENALKKQAAKLTAEKYGYYSERVYGETYGRFYQVSSRVEYYSSDWGGYASQTELFFADSLKEAKLADLFHIDFDYDSFIAAKVQETLNHGTGFDNGEYRCKTAEEAMEHLDISVQRDGFSISEKRKIGELERSEDRNFIDLYLFIPYEDMGCENITLFD